MGKCANAGMEIAGAAACPPSPLNAYSLNPYSLPHHSAINWISVPRGLTVKVPGA